MRAKLVLALSSIAAVLFISSVISIIEYSRMSDYVSRSLLEDMERNDAAENLADACRKYNLTILSFVGAADSLTVVNEDRRAASLADCDSASILFNRIAVGDFADSVLYHYNDYISMSMQLDSVIVSDFIDTRAWYFDALQPHYNDLLRWVRVYEEEINTHLMRSADDFENGFYRGIIPGIVVTGAGLVMIFLLLFFLLIFYVSPLRRILSQLDAFNKGGIKKYTVEFDGEDELAALNQGVKDLADENIQLKRKIRSLKKDDE